MLIDDHCTECDGNGYHTDDCPDNPNRAAIMRSGELEAAQAKENDGRGIVCIQAMLKYLERGQINMARNVWVVDGDKIRAYPQVQALCEDIFGCRLHGVKRCQMCIAAYR